jgi:ATP-binding cassette, subfamily C (CFTR/MRP), member 1
LFKGTLKFNLDPLNEINNSAIEAVLRQSGLQELLVSIKSLLDYRIEEDGGNLSAGEKQLICICRAILRRAKVVILDEATSNIDVRTEQTILKLMNEKLGDATVITIAHRLNTIIKSDKVAVLSDGHLVEYDSP